MRHQPMDIHSLQASSHFVWFSCVCSNLVLMDVISLIIIKSKKLKKKINKDICFRLSTNLSSAN